MHSSCLEESTKRASKDAAISHIKNSVSSLLNTESALILQFGSAFFKADELLSSDFDIVLVLKFSTIKDAYPTLTTTE